MDKSTYLKQLKTALRKKYAEPQVKDIFSDYEDFFASGMAAGKSEAELCAEFGPPERTVSDWEEPPRRDFKAFPIACSVFAIVFLVGFWVFRGVFLAPHINLPSVTGFWLDLLFPLSLEGVLAVCFSQKVSLKGGMKWILIIQIILAVPTLAALVWLIYYACSVPSFYGNLQDAETLAAVTGTLINVTSVILLASIVLSMVYAMHDRKRARRFLFLNTTLLVLILNFISLLSQINPEAYNGTERIQKCFLWAILPNLAAAGIDWAIRRIASVRRDKAWTGR